MFLSFIQYGVRRPTPQFLLFVLTRRAPRRETGRSYYSCWNRLWVRSDVRVRLRNIFHAVVFGSRKLSNTDLIMIFSLAFENFRCPNFLTDILRLTFLLNYCMSIDKILLLFCKSASSHFIHKSGMFHIFRTFQTEATVFTIFPLKLKTRKKVCWRF